ncbi:MAG: hypothetical protein ACN6PJ_16625 [Achromobacter sp.]
MKSRLAMAVALLTGVLRITNAAAQPTFPSSFKSQTVAMADGAKIFVRSAGTGPAVVLE